MRASFRALLLSAALGLLQSDGGAQPYAEVLSENVVVVAVCVEADPETVGCPHAKVQPKRKPDFAQFFEGVEVLSMAVDGYGKFRPQLPSYPVRPRNIRAQPYAAFVDHGEPCAQVKVCGGERTSVTVAFVAGPTFVGLEHLKSPGLRERAPLAKMAACFGRKPQASVAEIVFRGDAEGGAERPVCLALRRAAEKGREEECEDG